MIQRVKPQAWQERELILHPSVEQVIFVVLCAALVLVRTANLRYNTLFVDETFYILIGRDAWAGAFQQYATSWSYGSYLYPLIAAGSDWLFGPMGVRGLSALLSLGAMIFVFLTTTRLYGIGAGLWAGLIFGASGVSINLGQFGVYDTVATPLAAAAFYCLVRAGGESGQAERRWLKTGALVFILATFAKYFVVLYLPALILIALEFYLVQRRSPRALVGSFLGWVLPALAVYGLTFRGELSALFAGEYGMKSAPIWEVAQNMWIEIYIPVLLAIGGGLVAALTFLREHPRSRHEAALGIVLILGVATAIMAGPIYHLISVNIQSAWKHTIYSLIFLAPLAGRFCDSVVVAVRDRPGTPRLTARASGMLVTILLVSFFVNYGLDRNWGFQQSWPNAEGTVTYLRGLDLPPDAPILAEGAQIYQYYLGRPETPRNTFQNTWYVEYGDLTGLAAMRAAIADHYYAAVVLDDYYTPGLREQLEPALRASGYTLSYEEQQTLSLPRSISIRVYRLSH